MGKTKQQIQNELKAPGLGGDFSRSTDPNDPRRARAAQAASVTSQRFDPDQLEVDASGRLGLVLTPRRTQTVSMDFVARYNTAGAQAPVRRNNSTDSGLPAYAAVCEVFQTGNLLLSQWAFPPNLDKNRPITMTLNYVDREAIASSPLCSWDIHYWAWEPGQNLTRSADGTLQIVDVPFTVRDENVQSSVVITSDMLTPNSVELKTRIERVASSGTDPTEVGLHAVYLTYGVLWSHSHGRQS